MKILKRIKRAIWFIWNREKCRIAYYSLFSPRDSWEKQLSIVPTRKDGKAFVIVNDWRGDGSRFRTTAVMDTDDAETLLYRYDMVQRSRWGSVPLLKDYSCRFVVRQ